MSDIRELWKEIQAHGTLDPDEQSILDMYRAWGETSPVVPGFDPAETPASLDYLWTAASQEAEEQQAEQARMENERRHHYELGRAQAEGFKSASNVADPATLEGAFYRSTSQEEQVLLDKVAALERDFLKYKALAQEANSVGDFKEEESMLNLARFTREEFAELRPAYDDLVQKLKADRWEKGSLDYMSMSDDEKRAFDRQYPGHADEAFRRVANESPGKALPQRTSDGKAVYYMHPNYTAQELIDRLKEASDHNPALQVPDYKLAATAKEIDHPLMWNAIEVGGGEEQKEQTSEPEEVYSDVEILSVDDSGRETTHFSQSEMEPQSEPDEGPKPKTALGARI